jgi:type IV secretory pathway VirB2 component (pilin)
MKKLGKALKAGAIAAFAALVIAAPVFAADYSSCVGDGNKYPGLSTTETDGYIKCPRVKGSDGYVQFYGKSSADCAQAGTLAADPEACNGNDLNEIIQLIVNAIIFVIGIVAVVMIILCGISYATSQGDPSKVKKGKDTILYGIIGLIIALLAYAIVNFVLGALQG